MTTRRFIDPHFSVQNSYGVVQISFRQSHDDDLSIEVMLSPASQIALLQGLSQATTYALRDVLDEYERGQCTRCRNIRLVEETRHGQPWRVTCPACATPDVLHGRRRKNAWTRVAPWVIGWTEHFFNRDGTPKPHPDKSEEVTS